MKTNKILLNISAVVCFIFGAIYTFSLVFIPVAIYAFSAGKLFSYKADHLLDNFAADKKLMKGYTIFISIACFPLGLISLLAYARLYGNNVKVETNEELKVAETEAVENLEETQVQEKSEVIVDEVQETEEEKMEKLEKLKRFKEKQIISEEEYEMAKEQIFGKQGKK